MNTLKRQGSAILWVVRKSPLASSFYILLQIAAGLVPAVRILALARIVDSLSRRAELRAAALPLGVLMLTLAWDVVVPSFASFLEQRIQAVSAAEFQKGVLKKQARLKAEVLENKAMRERVERLQKQADDSIGLIFYRIINLLQSLVALVSQLTIFCGVRLWLGPAFLLAGFPALWIASKAGKVEYEENKKVTEHRRAYRMLHDVLVSRETSLERGLFGYTQKLDEQYKDEFEKARRFQHGVRKRMFVRMKVTGVLCAVVSFVLLALLLSVFARGEMTVGLFIALACAALNLVGLLMGSLPEQTKELSASNAFLTEAAEFTALPEQEGAQDAPRFEELREIELRHVSFAYPGTEKKVLDDVSIRMEKGGRYALIGVNGAGKSTLLKLMMRYYDNYSGEILINGQDVRELPYAVIKGFFGYVSQDSYHYTLTVRENLCMGETFSDDALRQALERVGLAQKVASMPQGLDTPLGKLSEQDVDLSGGEWQRLSIARALLRPYGMLLLDEPSSALDPVAERNFLDEIASATAGRSVLLISHRLSQARSADRLFVLDGGCISEQGTFDELMAKNGLFHRMYEEQKAWYQV